MLILAELNDDLFIHISVNATRANRESWGDTQYAEGLARAIRHVSGCGSAVFFRGESPEPTGKRDVVLRIIGPHLEEPVPGLPNMLWIISPPNLAPSAMLARYQAVFSASRHLVVLLRAVNIKAEYLSQATEGGHFHPSRRPADAPDIPVAFVGGFAARVDRRTVLYAVEAGFDVHIWGPGWAGAVPARHIRGERLEYDRLAEVYASARVVLNSHMSVMRRLGFMSNRSFDSIASGAFVVSDRIPGFSAPELPELVQIDDRNGLVETLSRLIDQPPLDHAARLALHGRLVRGFDFGSRAERLVRAARDLLAEGRRAAPAFRPGPTGKAKGGTAISVRLSDPAASAETQERGLIAAAEDILSLAAALEQPGGVDLLPAEPAATEGVIHPLMADLREMQALAAAPLTPEAVGRIDALVARARRLHEERTDRTSPFTPRIARRNRDSMLVRVIGNQPLWAHNPEGYSRETRKAHVMLQPRRDAVPFEPPVGVFLHLFHDDLAGTFAERLAVMDTAARIYVSTDTEAKADRIRASLPDADVRVLPNRGRDIWPKLYGFGDAHDRHEVVLHLHGKKSTHAARLNDWLAHILDCLLGSREDVNRILSMFRTIPGLGLVTPVAFRSVMAAAHWGANRDIARELAFRMGLRGALPANDRLQFPVGSMFWGRVSAMRPLLDLKLRPEHFPPEAGQVDGTLAHAIERMLGVVCTATGHSILPVTGSRHGLHARYRKQYGSNRALREALEAGEFDG